MSASCLLPTVNPENFPAPDFDPPPEAAGLQEAYLAGGCFWCTEAVFRRLDGVQEVMPGYCGGRAETADYKTVCNGNTGHVETIRIRFDAARVSLGDLLKVFFSVAHDPTQLDRQGGDIGSQYRSVVFFADAQQEEVARRYIAQLNAAGIYHDPIVTRVEPMAAFYPAEDYHHDYADQNPDQAYIRNVALPKVEKLQQWHADRLRKSES